MNLERKISAVASAKSDGTAKSSTSSSNSNINKKARSWTWIVYEEQIESVRKWLESAPDISWAMSPKHDRDKLPTGEPKKPHWHLVLAWNGPVTFNYACNISSELKLPIPQSVRNTRTMVRYFLHLDEDPKEKARYERKDIVSGGGFEVDSFLALSKSEQEEEEKKFVRDILNKIAELDLQEFYEVTNYVISEMPDKWIYFKKNSYILLNFMKTKLFHQGALKNAKK